MPSTIRGSDNFDTAGGNAVKAWVNFNGTGTVAIRASFNVSSITDNGTGNYTVNFTNALADANYSAQTNSSGGQAYLGTLTAASANILCVIPSSGVPVDVAVITPAFLR